MNKNKVIHTDTFAVHPDQAVEAVVHHLRLAAMFFEATPDNGYELVKEELLRQHNLTVGKIPGYSAPWLNPSYTWAALIEDHYNNLKKDD